MAIGYKRNWALSGYIGLREHIRGEFGGSAGNVAISRYRMGGSYVRSSGTYTWKPLADRTYINGRIPRFGQQKFLDYYMATKYRIQRARVNSNNAGINYASGISGGWRTFYSFPRGFASLSRKTASAGTFALLDIANGLGWPRYVRSNMNSSQAGVWTQGQYQAVKRNYRVTQCARAGVAGWITKTRARPTYVGNTNNPMGTIYGYFNSGDPWVKWFEIWAGAFSNDGTRVGGTIRPNGGDSSFRGSAGGGGKGGKGGTPAPGGTVLGGRSPASQINYQDIVTRYSQGYRYFQVMHTMQVRRERGSLNGNKLSVPSIYFQVTT
jgi:hypothetical protein